MHTSFASMLVKSQLKKTFLLEKRRSASKKGRNRLNIDFPLALRKRVEKASKISGAFFGASLSLCVR